MNNNTSSDYLDFHQMYKDFNSSFADFQRKERENDRYYDFEAYRDLKICLSLYAGVYDLLGYHHLEITPRKLSKMICNFTCYEKKNLILFFIKKLTEHGNLDIERKFSNLLVNQEILCSWQNVKQGKSPVSNILHIIFKLSSYHLISLILSLILLSFLFSLVFLPAPYSWMEMLEIKRSLISENQLINHVSNTLLYFFDIGENMEILPLNFWGVLILISLKVLIVLIIGNYLFKEIVKKIKFS